MRTQELQALMAAYDVVDNALLSHGYKRHMRDYELLIEAHVGPAEPGTYSYLFKHCVAVTIRTAVPDEIYRESLDDQLTEREVAEHDGNLEGFAWGAGWSMLYPGWALVTPSERAEGWTERIGIKFHELRIATSAYRIELIFSELAVTKVSDDLDPVIREVYLALEE